MLLNIEIIIVGIILLVCFGDGQKIGKLPSFNVYDKRVTLSGFSSGGAFSQMYQFSYSSQIHGIAVFGHTYYRCGPPSGKVDDYDRQCTKLFNYTEAQLYNPARVHDDIKDYYSKGYIDDPSNLRNKRLYVYAGLRNFLFSPDQSLSILKIYERYIKNPKRIRTRVQDSHLLMPTNNNYGKPCTESAEDRSFIGNCGFSGAFEALNFLHGSDHNMNEPQAFTEKNRAEMLGRLKEFDQTEFVQGLTTHQMDTKGFYFVPDVCTKRKCLLHVYFHGCLTGREFVGRNHIENSGYLEVANANEMIIIFPQASQSKPENDIGCWDTFGISGPLYATKRGAQITAIKRILDKATSVGSKSPGSGWSWSSYPPYNSQSPNLQYWKPSSTGSGGQRGGGGGSRKGKSIVFDEY